MGPNPADRQGEESGGQEEGNQRYGGPGQARDHGADRGDHHHVGAGRKLAQAVEVQQLGKVIQ